MPAHEIVLMGVTHVPEGRGIFPTLTVEENLNLGAYGRPKGEVAKAKERVFGLFPELKERRRQLAGALCGGSDDPSGGAKRPQGPGTGGVRVLLGTERIVIQGPAAELGEDERVRAAYLGGRAIRGH